MVSTKEDMVNFDKLENEVLLAMNADAKYQRENDAKFRAVDQKVASYDEFRDIVLASHLKPLEKDEKIEKLSDRFYQKWNVCAGSSDDSSTKPKGSQLTQDGRKLPQTSLEFGRDWRHYKSDKDKYELLLRLGGDELGKILHTEISMGLLGDMISALCSAYQDQHAEDIVHILEKLSLVNRFSLSVQFLSAKELANCKELFGKIRDSLAQTDRSEDSWKKLMEVYGVKE